MNSFWQQSRENFWLFGTCYANGICLTLKALLGNTFKIYDQQEGILSTEEPNFFN